MADLTTIDAVRAFLEIQGTSSPADDEMLASYIAWANDWFDSQTDRKLGRATYTQVAEHIGDGSVVVLEQHPVASVTSLVVDGETIPASLSWDAEGWWLDGNVLRLRVRRIRVGQLVTVVYAAGYADGSIPGDLEQAAIEMIALRFRERASIGQSSMSAAGYSVTYLPTITPRTVREVVSRYRRPGC